MADGGEQAVVTTMDDVHAITNRAELREAIARRIREHRATGYAPPDYRRCPITDEQLAEADSILAMIDQTGTLCPHEPNSVQIMTLSANGIHLRGVHVIYEAIVAASPFAQLRD